MPNPSAPWMGPNTGQMGAHFEAEMEINDFPQHARWKVCSRTLICFQYPTDVIYRRGLGSVLERHVQVLSAKACSFRVRRIIRLSAVSCRAGDAP